MNEWIKLSREGMDWVVKRGYEQSIPDKIWDKAKRPAHFPECQVVKDNILRTSILISFPKDSEQDLFLKRNHRRHWKDDVKSLFIPSRSFSEWKTLFHLQRLNLPVPDPLAYGERRHHGILKDSCLIVEAIDSAQPLNSYFSQQSVCPAKKKFFKKKMALITRLAHLIARLHHCGVYYRDLHGGNILIRGTEEVFFVDTEKVRFVARMSTGKRIRDLAMLYNSLFVEANLTWIKFLKIYLEEEKNVHLHWKKFFREIEKIARAFRERHIKSRSKRCLKKSTSFGIRAEGKRKVYFRKEFTEAVLQQALDKIKRFKKEDKNGTIGKAGKIKIYRIRIPDNPLYPSLWVREYRYTGMERVKSLIGFSLGKTDWFNSNGLLVRKVPAPLPLSLVEEKGIMGIKASVLITEDLSSCDRLDAYIPKHFQPENQKTAFSRKIHFVHGLAKSFNQLYDKKVFLKNVKAENIFVNETDENSWRFYFGNVNQITFNHPVSADKKLINLIHFNATIPFEVGWKDRLRFLFHFLRSRPRKERKVFVRKILDSNKLIAHSEGN